MFLWDSCVDVCRNSCIERAFTNVNTSYSKNIRGCSLSVAFPQQIGTSPFLPPLPLGHIYAAEDTPSPAAPSIEYSMAPTTPSAEDSPAPTTSSAGDTTAPVASPAATPAPATLTVRKNGLYSVSYFYVTFFWAHEAFR